MVNLRLENSTGGKNTGITKWAGWGRRARQAKEIWGRRVGTFNFVLNIFPDSPGKIRVGPRPLSYTP